MKVSFSDFLDKMKRILTVICPRFPLSNFPQFNSLRFMDFLLEKLGELSIHDPSSVAAVKHYIEEIQLNLQSWRPFIMNALDSDAEHLELKSLAKQATCVVYKVAYVIDLIEIDGHWQHILWLYNLLEEIRLIDRQVRANQERPSCTKVHKVARISSHMISRANENGEMVGSLRDQILAIIAELIGGSTQKDIVSVVGMPGIGKTTLAKKVYNDPNVAAQFHRRAWCSVSQTYSNRELMLDILKDIHGLDAEIHQKSDADLEVKLYRLLKQNRYLIVMDDLWDVGALNDLRKSFPEDKNGSRILITSRLHNVALDARPNGDPHSLPLLSEEESWNLLEMKVFHKEGLGCCPEELVEVGKKIARVCKGLPLSVVAIAGILERTLDCWGKIAENLSSQIIDDPQTQCKDIIELSYMRLPLHLRECFLYFGAFLEDKDVSVSKLIRLWIAEGFIEKIGLKSLEDTAEDYLMDLISRSLVMISRRRSIGMVKSCSIHDLLRDFCISKAKAGNLFHLTTKHDEPYASFEGVDYGTELYDHCVLNPVSHGSYRLFWHLKRKHFVDSRPSGPWTRSLMLLASTDANPRCHYDISFIPQHFRLLSVLDLECINISNGFPSEIERLVHLRYLAVSGDVNSIPGSIENIWRLETFIVKGSSDKIVLPGAIWRLAKLRHLHVKNCAIFNVQDGMTETSLELDYLVTFSSPALSNGMENIIMRLPNLRKLSCIFCKSWDSSRNTSQFPELYFLTRLESLRIMYSGSALNSAEFGLPVSIKKLTLSNFGLPWNQIDAIARLPNLEVLKLLCRAFEGPKWDMRDVEFLELKFLMLDSLNIVHWIASADNLPKLQQLVVKNCTDLVELPSDFAESGTLQMIEVQRCKQSVEESPIS